MNSFVTIIQRSLKVFGSSDPTYSAIHKTKTVGKRCTMVVNGSCIGIKLFRGLKWLTPTNKVMVMILVDVVEDCIGN